jgi:hypothetical protein
MRKRWFRYMADELRFDTRISLTVAEHVVKGNQVYHAHFGLTSYV